MDEVYGPVARRVRKALLARAPTRKATETEPVGVVQVAPRGALVERSDYALCPGYPAMIRLRVSIGSFGWRSAVQSPFASWRVSVSWV